MIIHSFENGHSMHASTQNILDYFERTYPNPECFLHYTTHYTLLIAVLLSAQCTDRAVNLVMPAIIQHADSAEKMIDLGVDRLMPMIKTIGLYSRKSQHIIALSHQLIDHHDGCVPCCLEDLVALPGVGRKTANVVLNVLFQIPTIPVDTHVERVSKRLGWVRNAAANPVQVENSLENLIPMPWKKNLHAWLILHGRTFCQSRSPQCTVCPLQNHCHFFQNRDTVKNMEKMMNL